MQRAGAHVLDVGGESTRPGAAEVPAQIELARVVPVLEALAKATRAAALDRHAQGRRRARRARGRRAHRERRLGRALRSRAASRPSPSSDAYLVIGHLRGTPATMQDAPHFDDVLAEVARRARRERRARRGRGRRAAQIAVDPGIGFGKRQHDNLVLLANAGRIGERLGKPVLVGPSRKSFLGRHHRAIPSMQRDVASAAACAVAVFAGANAIRVHDVGAGVRAAQVAAALRGARA